MSHNPLAPEVAKRDAQIVGLHGRRARLAESLDWHSGLDIAAAREEADRLRHECDEADEQLSATRELIATLNQETAVLRAKTQVGMDPRYWFAADRYYAKVHFGDHVRKLLDLEVRQSELVNRLERSRPALEEATLAIARYDQFDAGAASTELEALDDEIAAHQVELDGLSARKELLDQQLEGAVASLTELQTELVNAEARQSSLRSATNRLKREIKTATELADDLSEASDSRDRWKIHQQCEDDFNDGNPRRVLADRRRKLNEVRHEISALDRRLPAMRRDVEKAEGRVAAIADHGSRRIRAIVIDGNNLCYQDDEFIGLAALRPLCLQLRESYEVTVVFDASIRRLLGGQLEDRRPITRDELREELPHVTLHVVAARTQADETILATAVDPVVYVLSNDRFSEYRDKPAVRERRLITHEILNGQVLVHELGINLRFNPRR